MTTIPDPNTQDRVRSMPCSAAAPCVRSWRFPLGANTVNMLVECASGELDDEFFDAWIELATMFKRNFAAVERTKDEQITEQPNDKLSDGSGL